MANKRLSIGCIAVALVLAWAAAPVRAAEGDPANPVNGLVIGLALALGMAAFLGFWLYRSRRTLNALRESIRGEIAATPVGLIRWSRGGVSVSARARELLDLDGDAEKFAAEDVARSLADVLAKGDSVVLKKALAALRESGESFEESFVAEGGKALSICGRRIDDADLVWLADASELARTTEILARREDRIATMRGLLDVLPLAVWWRDGELNIAGCNLAYARACDSERDAILETCQELAAGYIDNGGRALAERASRTRMAQSESHHVVIGGGRRMLEFTETPLGAENGGIVGYATDATALEAVQDQMADHLAAHAEVLEGLNTAIAIFGADKRLKFFNTAYAEMTGIEEEMLRGEPTMGDILEWLRERRRLPEYVDFPAFKQERDRWFTSLIEPFEELMHLPDETTIRAVVSPHPLGGLIFAMEDVTDRLALESSYNTLIEVQRETLNRLHEGVAVFGGDGRLRLSNAELGRIWKLSESQLDGEPHVSELIEAARDFFPQEADWPTLKERLVLMVTERAVRGGRLNRADESVIRYASVPLPDGNTLLSFLDVSDSARVERALRERNVALEKADRIKSEFIGNVSYELRTPLTAIVGFTEILDNRYFGELTDRQAEYVGCVLQASTHLMLLIDDILDLATIEAGYMVLDLQPVEVRGLLERLAEFAAERAEQADLKIEIDCPEDIGTVSADPVRLRQALFNLVSNAIQFTPSGGTITLRARREGDDMLLIVSDTGIGIAPEDKERVFDRFERADPNARESGAGLGLALCKSLLELHGGAMTLDSEPGKGTDAICRLPVDGVAKSGEEQSDTESAA